MATRRKVVADEMKTAAATIETTTMTTPREEEVPLAELDARKLLVEMADEKVPEVMAFKAADAAYQDFLLANSTLIAQLEDLAHVRARRLDAVEELQKNHRIVTPTFPTARSPNRSYDADALAAWVQCSNQLMALSGQQGHPPEHYGLSLRPASYTVDVKRLEKVVAAKELPMTIALECSKPVFAYRRYRRLDLMK